MKAIRCIYWTWLQIPIGGRPNVGKKQDSFQVIMVSVLLSMILSILKWNYRFIAYGLSSVVEENTESIDHPLHEAAKRGNINFLIECLNNKVCDGFFPQSTLNAILNYVHFFKQKKKVSVNGLDKAGSTALHWAARGGHLECVVKLLEVPNVQVNVQNKLGDTPLHSAAWKGHSEIVKLLLQKGEWWLFVEFFFLWFLVLLF